MALDLKKTKLDYDASNIEDKRSLVLAMLQGFAGKGQIFDDLFVYITNNPQDVTIPELDEIFQIIMVALYHDSQDKLKEAGARLDVVKTHMITMRQKE